MYRKIWTAITAGVSTVLTHNYSGNTLTGARYMVSLRFEVSEGGRETGREIDVRISPERARRYAADLLAIADRTDQRNQDAGVAN